MPADVRSCTPVPLRNLHGKEGVHGSSPAEGSGEASARQTFAQLARIEDADAAALLLDDVFVNQDEEGNRSYRVEEQG